MKFGDLRPRGDSEFLPRERKAMAFGDLRPRNLSQETPKDNGGFLDSAINLGNWWKGNSLASAGYLGGLLSETAGNILQGIGEKFDEGTLPRRALEGAGQISQSVADKMLDFSEKNFDVADENTASGNIANQLMSGLTGSLGSLGRMIHADKSADALKKASESTAEKNRVSTDDLGEYFTSSHGFWSDAANFAGQQIPTLPLLFAKPLPIIEAAVAKYGGNAVTQGLINSGRYGTAKWFAQTAPRMAQYAPTVSLFEAGLEGGETRGNRLAQGATEEEATRDSLITMAKNIPLLLATNTLESLVFFSPLRGANKALQIGERGAVQSLQQQYEEFAQEGIQNAALGKPYSWLPWAGAPEQYEAAERVRYPALLMGGLGGATQALGGTNENQKNWEQGSQENISNEDYSARANARTGIDNFMRAIVQQESGDTSQTSFDGPGSQSRGGNIFGVENYDMPVAQMESSLEGLKPGWSEILPQIGGVLKNKFGYDPIITSGARTREHQMRINPSAPNSYHIIQDDGGDAVDIAFNDGELSAAKEQELLDYFKSTGLFSEVLYHAVVGGKHLHLGGLKTDNLNRGQISQAQENAYDPNFTEKQNEIWQVAQYASARAKEKFGYDIPPELIYKQWVQEAGPNFDSPNARYNNNFGGLTQVEPNGEENKQPDGNNYYRIFNNPKEYADAFVDDFIKYYPEINGVKTEREYASVLKKYGYFGSPLEEYIAGMEGAIAPSTRSNNFKGGAVTSKNSQRDQQNQTKPLFDLNSKDSTTQKLLEKFAREKRDSSTGMQAAEDSNFFEPMFTDKDVFKNTQENRTAILENYGDEFNSWARDKVSQSKTQEQPRIQTPPQIQPPAQIQAPTRTESKVQPKASAQEQPQPQIQVQSQEQPKPQETQTQNSQPQQDPVNQNKPPENILTQPKKNSLQERLTRVADSPISNKRSERIKQGRAIKQLAKQNQIDLPRPVQIALDEGSTKGIETAQNILQENISSANTQQVTKTQSESAAQLERKKRQESLGKLLAETDSGLKRAKESYEELLAETERRLARNQNNSVSTQPQQEKIPQTQPAEKKGEGYTVEAQEQKETTPQIQSEHFNSGIFWHPDLNTEFYSAKPQKVPNNISKEVQSLAKQHDGSIEREFGKGFIFKTAEQRDTFIKEADELIKNAPKKESVQPRPSPQVTDKKVAPVVKDSLTQAQEKSSKRMDPADVEKNIYEIIPSDKFIDSEEILMQIDEIEPDELYSGLAALEGKGIIEEEPSKNPWYGNTGRYKRTGKILNENNITLPAKQEQPAQTQPPKEIGGVYGKETQVITRSRTPHQIQYKVVEADNLTSSHEIDNGGVFANKNYPSEFQPRNRTRADMQAQLISMSNNLNPADLLEARDVNQGAPVIRNDGVVLNGNGRTAAIRYAYKNGKGTSYKNSLVQSAEKLGLNADEISKMNQPILVRELTNDLSVEEVQDLTGTQTGGARMGASEQAQYEAAKLSSETLSTFPQSDNIDLTRSESAEFLRSALADIATPDERNSLTQNDGRINQDGINRVKRALFAKAYGDGGLIARMSESTDDNVLGVTNALLNAAPHIAKVKAAMEAGTLHKYDFSPITDAVKKLSALRDEGKPVTKYLQEQNLFGEDSAESKEILSFLDKNKRAPKKITKFFKNIAKGIERQGDPRQENLFGENEPAPLMSLIRQAAKSAESTAEQPSYSKQGDETLTKADVKYIVENNLVANKDLTPQQKLIKSFGEKLGVKTVFFYGNKPVNGKTLKGKALHGFHVNNVNFINVNSKMPIGKVFWHESLHWLKANNPKLYQQLAKSAEITDAQRQAYIEQTGRNDLTTDAAIDEEIIADAFEDTAKRTGLLQNIAGKDRGLIERVVQWLKDTMNKFIDHFRNPDGKLTTKQSVALADEFGSIANRLKDQYGNKIFRYNRRTHNVEVIPKKPIRNIESIGKNSARPTEKVQPTVDFAEDFADNEEGFSQKIFDKYLTKGIQKMVRDTVRKEIGEHVDLSKMSDPVERDEARDMLPCIRKMITWYNTKTVQGREDYKNHFATRIEYARRCFENDNRIRNESVKSVNGNYGQGRKHTAGDEAVPGNDAGRNNRDSGRIARGVSTNVSGGRINARNHFLKLYNDIAKPKRSVQQRGVFDSRTQPKTSNEIKFSFAGEKAKTTDKTALEKAKQMEEHGASRDEIFEATGWVKGKDNKWRFEIPDNIDKIDFKPLKDDFLGFVRLSEIYDNPALYEAYPDLATVTVKSSDNTDMNGRLGDVSGGGRLIRLNNEKLTSYDQAKSTLVHEIQHIIQGIEDFAEGGTPGSVLQMLLDSRGSKTVRKLLRNTSSAALYQRLGGEQEAREVQKRAAIRQYYQKLVSEHKETLEKEKSSSTKEQLAALRDYEKLLSEINGGGITNEQMALLDKYKAKMGKKLFERYDDYSMWNGILESSGKETPTLHGDDAIIVFGGKEFPSAYVAPLKTRQDSNIKYSIGNDAEQSFFSKTWNKFAKALHLDGDKIITEEDRRKARLQEQEKAMADYLKEPAKENKQRMKKLGVTKGQLDAYMNGEEYLTGIGLIQNYRSSPSRIADKVAVFRAFFRMGDRAQDKLVKLRDQFQNHYNKAMNFVKDEKAHAQLVDLLLDGDVTEQEFGTLTEAEVNKIKTDNPQNPTQAIQRAKIEKICKEQEVPENVAKAYLEIRRQLNRTHTLADDAHRRPQNHAQHLSNNQYEKLRDNKFVKNLKIHDEQDDNGKHLVTWTEYANQEREYTVDGSVRGRFLMDDAIQILDERQNPDGSYTVTVREGIPELNKIRGYIPHFFHEFHVAVKDANGKQVGDIIGTGRTQREAIKIAEQWKKNHTLKDGENIHITPRTFGQTLGVSENNTPIMGDKDFEVMMSRIKKNTGTTLAEAKQIVDGAVKTKNRHRFLGQLLKRKGYKGYEQDMDWVLRHHFNTVARYVALETEFKPKAISLFERVFGDFYKDHSKNLLAKYTKDYINDVNGNPAWIDEVVNQTLNQNSWWRKYFLPNIGEQGFQRIGNSVAGRIAYLKLGMGNISSALLNFTQLTNAAGYVGWQPLMKHFGRILAHGGKLNQNELRILNGSGVIADIGLDTASGYDKNRGYGSSLPILKQLDWLGNKSMIPFQKCDTLCRMSTALAAYENAIKDGKARTQALEYAKKVNRDANFSYGVEDAPNIFRRTSTFGKVGLQFMKYPIKQLEVIADFLPQNKKTTFKQKAAFWIPYFFMSGLIGFIPFFDWGDDKLSKNFNIFPKDFMQKLVIQGTQEIFGKDSEAGRMVGKVIMYGAPALANIDVSKRTGLASMLPQDTFSLLFGATGSTILGTGTNLAQGNYANALRSVSPGLFNIYSALWAGETKDARGRKVSVYEDAWDRIVRGIGFKSVDESLATDIQRISSHERSDKTRIEQRAIDDYIEDPSPENLKRLKELKIKPARVKEERKKKKLDRMGRAEQNMTKAQRRQNQYLMDFAK